MDEPARIKPLASSVVNRIAAGEIVIGPSNALKEIMENSIDAGSTTVDILVKEGGLKLLQVTDNGTGIAMDDLPILCERFTTSKLQKFEDLNSIATYGFRGEALASISHIAHLSVTTKTKKSSCAWRCLYVDGVMVPLKPKTEAEPKPVAGKDGTQITVEDLFYNVPSRLRTIKSANEEFGKIVDVVGRYAVHTDGVGFSCKKVGETFSALSTRSGMSRKDRIRTVFGSVVANDLIETEIGSNEDIGLLKCFGQVTTSNYVNKKVIQPVFFINNRLVQCDPLKRAINLMYALFLPKGNKPFVYMALEIDPLNVDVNVHPTKREVRFLHEEEIIEYVVTKLQESLMKVDSSRTFLTQQVLPNTKRTQFNDEETRFTAPSSTFKKAKIYDNNLVRTDASQAKITSFVSKVPEPGKPLFVEEEEADVVESLDDSVMEDTKGTSLMVDINEFRSQKDGKNVVEDEEEQLPLARIASPTAKDNLSEDEIEYVGKIRQTVTNHERVNIKLSSILSLRQEVAADVHRELTEIFAKHTFVGIVDQQRRLAAIQYDVKLLLVDYASVSFHLFYQIGLSDFGNFGRIHLNPKGVSIRELLENVYDNAEFMATVKDEIKSVDDAVQIFIDMKEMLEEYFAISIDTDSLDPKLMYIPMLLKEYIPPMKKLAIFMFRLANKINWTEEKECLDGILRQIGLFYVPESLADVKITDLQQRIYESVLFPCIKRRFLAPTKLSKDVVEIANLPGLYRVFERC